MLALISHDRRVFLKSDAHSGLRRCGLQVVDERGEERGKVRWRGDPGKAWVGERGTRAANRFTN